MKKNKNLKVSIVMGSQSDYKTMKFAGKILKKMGANITIHNKRNLQNEPIVDMKIRYTHKLKGINLTKDLIPPPILDANPPAKIETQTLLFIFINL